MGFLKQGFSGALAAVMVLTSGGLCVGQSVTIHAETKAKTYEDYKKVLNYTAEYQGYEAYKEGLENVKRPETSYEINGADYVTCEGMEPEVLTDYEGMEGTSVYTEESGMLTYEVDIAEEGMYEFGISYYPVAGNGSSIQRSFFVDGELSYRELSLIEFSRVWVNTSDIWDEDNQGNDLKPTQMEAPEWLFSRFYDQDGYVTEPLSIFLTKGKHEITVVSRREPMILHSIYLQNEESLFDYKTVYEQQKKDGVSDTSGQSIEIQAEYATKKSSRMLYPVQDQSSPAITPYSAKELKNNSIGGNSWRLTGQWIEWEFDADADGFYNITLHSKQNFVQFGDHLAHHGKIAFLGQRQAVLPDQILCALLHSHVQQCGAQIPPRGAAIAAQQCVGGTLPHHGHAVGQGAVHIKDPLLAVHYNASF